MRRIAGLRLLALTVGALFVSCANAPLGWVLRLWALGWLAELMAGIAGSGWPAPFPEWWRPVRQIRRGLELLFVLSWFLIPASALMSIGWTLGWTASFNRSPIERSLGQVILLAGLLLLAAAAVLAPLASVRTSICGLEGSRDLRYLWRLATARPWRHVAVLAGTAVLAFPLQAAGQFQLQSGYEYLLIGAAAWLVLVAVKMLWASHYRALVAASTVRRPRARFSKCVMALAGFLYAFSIVFCQFWVAGGQIQWFSHVAYLLPGVPPLIRLE